MPGPVARPLEVRRAEVAVRLQSAVQDLLADGSQFGDLSVEQIASAGGIVRSTFYAHFDDKIDLLLVLGRSVIDDLIAVGMEWAALPERPSVPELARILNRFTSIYLDNRGLMGAMSEEALHDIRVRREFNRLYSTGMSVLTAHFAERQSTDTSARGFDVEPTLRWIMAMIDHGLYLIIRQGVTEDVDRQIDALARIIWNTLYAPGP